MDRQVKKSVRRLLLLDALVGITSSVSNNINELGEAIDEIFETASVKRKQVKEIFTEEQAPKRNNI